jgi:amino acid transporter
MLLVYFGVSLSVIWLRIKLKAKKGDFKIPFGYTVPILSAGIILFFLSNLTGYEKTGLIIFFVALTVVYFLVKAVRTKKTKS